eukprot:TRINITY_DN2295_c0_g1_i15.p2 TRINITY_DN2295_c0_g1~~TRINITY_DN2295_c0_g1_i15.p2  ORF type:complete len:270 (+),score=72.69 TRINITY_DN2295_c0_g1_i15:1205-2014(+)
MSHSASTSDTAAAPSGRCAAQPGIIPSALLEAHTASASEASAVSAQLHRWSTGAADSVAVGPSAGYVNKHVRLLSNGVDNCQPFPDGVRPLGDAVLIKFLGRGISGEVWEGVRKGRHFAAKYSFLDNADAVAELKREAVMYCVLHDVQGVIIPQLLGFTEVSGFFAILLVKLGPSLAHALRSGLLRDVQLWKKRSFGVLQQLHNRGFVHGDPRLANFCLEAGGEQLQDDTRQLFLIDLARVEQATEESRSADLAQLNSAWEEALSMMCC